MPSREYTARTRTDFVTKVFGIDTRALAAFRIGLGSILLVDLGNRAADLVAHYSDAGVLPLSALDALAPGIQLSFHAWSGAVEWQAFLFVLAGAFATALLVGYRTRCVTVLSWGFMLSLHHRNPFVINSGDSIFLVLLLWGCLLPLGMRWSLDARRMRRAPRDQTVFSVATAGVLLQLYAVYLLSIVYKTGATWREDFTAVYYALQLDAYTTALGQALGDAPLLVLQAATVMTLVVEFAGPLLALSPFRSGAARTVAAFALIGFHVGLATTMTLGIFPFVCMAAWLLVLPAPFWDLLGRWASRAIPSIQGRTIEGWRPHGTGPPAAEPTALVSVVACALLVMSVLVSWRALDPLGTGFTFGRSVLVVDRPASALLLKGRWGMFAPDPSVDDVWYETVGLTAEGEQVDLADGRPYRPVRADEASSRYRTQRWRKLLFEHFGRDPFSPHRGHYAAFLWSDWHRQFPNRPLQSIEVATQTEPSPAWGEAAQIDRLVLVRYRPRRARLQASRTWGT